VAPTPSVTTGHARPAPRRDGSPGTHLGALIAVAGGAGVAATALQLLDRIALTEDPQVSLVCDISSVLSCGSVLTAWQSSALGVPNAMIGLAVFSVFLSAGLTAALGGTLSLRYLRVLEAMALGMLGFTLWYLAQTTFVLGALCLYCTVVGTSVVLVNLAVSRLWRRAGGLGGRGPVARLARGFVDSGDDRWVWAALWLGVATVITLVLAG
jgi:uncharacterized membrane protein